MTALISDLNGQMQTLEANIKSAADSKSEADFISLSQTAQRLADTAAEGTQRAANTSAEPQKLAVATGIIQRPPDGWMFLGKVTDGGAEVTDNNVEAWSGRPIIKSDSPKKLLNNVYEVDANTFIHANQEPPDPTIGKGWFARQKVIGVVKTGDFALCLKIHVYPANDSGYSMWALVQRID